VTGSALHLASAVDLRERVVSGESSAEQITVAFLERIARLDTEVGAFLYVDAAGALQQARKVDAKRAAGATLGPLAGVPVGLKDNLCTLGIPTTCASRILEGYRPPYDADCVERLRAADAVAVGKLNLDEFAMGSSNENSAFGPVHNPWDLERTPGGSSGGAAASIAARLVTLSLGSDTGGSVRQPAAYCGVTAIKPTYGRVSRYGLIAFASSLDQVGPITIDVRDGARMLSVIAGADPRDATSATHPVADYEAECGKDVRGMRVGVVRGGVDDGCDAAVRAAFDASLRALAGLGCELVDVELPHARYGVSAYYLVAAAEASSNLARFDGMRYGLRVPGADLNETYEATRARGFGPEVKRRIMLGTYALSAGYYDAYYLKAQKVRTLIRRDYDAAFDRCDVLVTPTAPTTAFKLGEKVNDPISMYLQDIFTLPPSLAGIPAIGTPCGVSPDGLPLGLQICAPHFEEARMIRLAHAFEAAIGWQRRAPAFAMGAT
jgi:aspartyl-tRNA(Asn)/glutamyl-tRNA(Gln) amidotransferase subunit A